MLPLPLPPSQHQHQHQHQARSPAGQTAHHHPSMPPTTGLGDEAGQALATANVAAAAVGGSGCGSGSSSGYRSPRSTAGGAAGGAVVGAGTAGSGVVEKAKVKSIKLMDRLMPTELAGVSLPFREATLRNGDVVAKRGTGIVLHTRVEGRRGNLWLKCRSNQDRGALVDALVPWFETNLLGKRELDVQQVRARRAGRGCILYFGWAVYCVVFFVLWGGGQEATFCFVCFLPLISSPFRPTLPD